MLRKAIVGLIVGLLLPLGVVATAPTTASADRNFRTWGTAKASDKVLPAKNKCRVYSYRYRIAKEQRNDWAAEIFFVDPRGRGIYSEAKLDGANPPRGKGTFEICRNSTNAGRFKIKMKVTYYADENMLDKREGFVKPTFFRMTRPR